MFLEGNIYKDGKFWLAEFPVIDLMTQGLSRKELVEVMIPDLFETIAQKKNFKVTVHLKKNGSVLIDSNDPVVFRSLLLRKLRENSGLSLAEVAKKMGFSSRNSYQQYEKGRTSPTIDKFYSMIKVLTPKADLILTER